MYLGYTLDGIVLVSRYCVTCLNLLFLNHRGQIYIYRSEGCWTCVLMSGLTAGKDVGHAGGYPRSRTLGTV